MDFQSIIFNLQKFWSEQGCAICQPYDIEVGAGTMNPATFLRVLGPEPWKAAYVEPSRRPAKIPIGFNSIINFKLSLNLHLKIFRISI